MGAIVLFLLVSLGAVGGANSPQTVYVRKDGSDDWGEGVFELPFLTIQKAIDSITDASSIKNYVIIVGSGIYADAFSVKPWIRFDGDGVVTLTSSATISFDSSAWSAVVSGTVWFSNFLFQFTPTFSFPTTSNATLFFFPSRFNFGATFVGNHAPSSHTLILSGIAAFATLTIQDIQTTLTFGGASVHGYPVVVRSTMPIVTTIWSISGAFDAGLNLTTISGGGGVVGEMRGCSVQGIVYLDGAATIYRTTVEGIPSTVVKLNNAPTPVYLSYPNALGFVPAVSANWVSSVPTVQDALDYVGSKVPRVPITIWIVQEQQTSGTNGQDSGGGTTFTSGAWRIRALNTISSASSSAASPTGNVALASSVLTIQPGTYIVHGSTTARRVGSHQARIFDITGSAAAIIGTNSQAANLAGLSALDVMTRSSISGIIVVSSSARTYRLEHQCETTRATDGFGIAAGFGTEVYSELTITQIS